MFTQLTLTDCIVLAVLGEINLNPLRISLGQWSPFWEAIRTSSSPRSK